MRYFQIFVLTGLLALSVQPAWAKPLSVVCVEAAWCDIVKQIGGEEVETRSLISSPTIDPHEIIPTPSMIREISSASVFIINGAAYDDWVKGFSSESRVVRVADIVGWKPQDNQHLFLNIDNVRKFSFYIKDKFFKNEENKEYNLFLLSLDKIDQKIKEIKKISSGKKIAMIEPIGSDLLENLRFNIIDKEFSLSTLSHREPSPKEIAEMEKSFDKRDIKFLVVNPSIQSTEITRITSYAQNRSIPFIEIGETLPKGLSWQEWVFSILESIQKVMNEHA
ncbi:metal ABC transporter solute-binding protein, Zn/Mn family [Swingsia samuiensis]|uniref:ABC transporter substrate-binding protein n=1 Tax=Swingsia samuiensis TaxID=1293412 RepID=A0A4Y6UIK1_9PROT|nr:zinc ABC transporter substrate-binding protein [Swingsia samuiensis]QDH16894.1 ABC transporter substrate-binding protein [Swingsia samuiensis]